ncbi:hypothetical protein [Streptomyces sp. NPDC058441]
MTGGELLPRHPQQNEIVMTAAVEHSIAQPPLLDEPEPALKDELTKTR